MICSLLAAMLPWLGVAACAPDMPPFERRVIGADPVEGRRLVAATACTACHAVPGLPGPHGNVGPSLRGFGSRALVAGELPNRPAVVVRFVRDAPSLVPGTAMPALALRESEARDIAAFLMTLR